MTGKMAWWLESINRKNQTGVMIAFLVPKGTANGLTLQQDALPTGSEALPPDDLHLTLAFLGEASEMLIDRSEVLASLALFAAQQPPLTGRLNGLGAFTAQGGKYPLYTNFDCAELPEFRQDLIAALAAVGVDINSQHGFTPHVTLAYVPEGAETSGLTVPDKEVTFDRVGLFWGGQVEFCPLKGDVTMSARAKEGNRKLTDVTSHQVAEAMIGEDRTPDGGYLLSGVVIAEGISANGNLYTIEALKSGGGAFAGRPIYADHPSRSEESDRPERSVRDLVGRLSENKGDFWIERNKNGTNVLRFKNARLSTTAGWLATMIKEGIAGDMSINAMGSGEDVDGMFNVTEFTEATSLDFVTVAAAGGLGTVAEGDRRKPTETDLPGLTLVRLAAARPDLVNTIAARERQKAYGERDTFRQMRRQVASQDKRVLELEAEATMERALASSGLPVPIQKAVRGVCQGIVAEHLSRPVGEQGAEGQIATIAARRTREQVAGISPDAWMKSEHGDLPSVYREDFLGWLEDQNHVWDAGRDRVDESDLEVWFKQWDQEFNIEARRAREAKTMPVTFWINSADLDEDEAGKFKKWLKKEKGDAAGDQKSKADWKALYIEFGKVGEKKAEEAFRAYKVRVRQEIEALAAAAPLADWAELADAAADYLGVYNADGFAPGWMRGIARGVLEADAPVSDEVKQQAKQELLKHKDRDPSAPALLAAGDIADLLDLFGAGGHVPDWLCEMAEDIFEARRRPVRRAREQWTGGDEESFRQEMAEYMALKYRPGMTADQLARAVHDRYVMAGGPMDAWWEEKAREIIQARASRRAREVLHRSPHVWGLIEKWMRGYVATVNYNPEVLAKRAASRYGFDKFDYTELAKRIVDEEKVVMGMASRRAIGKPPGESPKVSVLRQTRSAYGYEGPAFPLREFTLQHWGSAIGGAQKAFEKWVVGRGEANQLYTLDEWREMLVDWEIDQGIPFSGIASQRSARETTPPPDVVITALRDAGFSAEEQGFDVVVSMNRRVTTGEVWTVLMDHGVDRAAIKQRGDQVIVTTSYEARRRAREQEDDWGGRGVSPQVSVGDKVYHADTDYTGIVISLASGGTETWAWDELITLDSGMQVRAGTVQIVEAQHRAREQAPDTPLTMRDFSQSTFVSMSSRGQNGMVFTWLGEQGYSPDETKTLAEWDDIMSGWPLTWWDSPFKHGWASAEAASVREQTDFARVPPQMLEGLCDAIGPDPGFHTRCMDKSLGEFEAQITDKAAFCAELHKQCVGKWPAEEARRRVREFEKSPGPITVDQYIRLVEMPYKAAEMFKEFLDRGSHPGFVNASTRMHYDKWEEFDTEWADVWGATTFEARRRAREQSTIPEPPGTIAPVNPELEPGDAAVIELPPDAAALPEEAQMLWLETYISYLDGGEESAMHRAWSAVYDDGWEKDESGRWIKGRTTELIVDDTAGSVLDIVTLPEETTAEEARRRVKEQQPAMTPNAWGRDVGLNDDEMREWLAFVDSRGSAGPDEPVDMSTLELWWNDHLQSIGISPYEAGRRAREQEGEGEAEEEPPEISLADFVDQQEIGEEQASAFRAWLDENDKAPGEAKPAEEWEKAYAGFQEKGEAEEEIVDEEESLRGREAGREHRRSGLFQGLGLEMTLGEFLSDRPDVGTFAGKFEQWLVRESGIYQRGEVFSLEEWQEMLAAYERQTGRGLASRRRTREEEDGDTDADENEITAAEYAQHHISPEDKDAWLAHVEEKGVGSSDRERMDFWDGLEQEWDYQEARRVKPSQSLEDKLKQVIAAARTEWGGQIDRDLVRGVGSGPGLPGDFSDEDLKEAFRGLLPDDALDFVVEGR